MSVRRWLAFAALVACSRPAAREPVAGDTMRSRATTDTVGTHGGAGTLAPLVRRPWHPYDNQFRDTTDRGTGVVTLAIGSDSGRVFPSEDTLLFRESPRGGSPVVAALIRERPSPGGWSYAALAPPNVTLNFLEHGYEESGVPIDSSDGTGRWVRAIIGFTPDKQALHGWAALDTPFAERLQWDSVLAERAWYFLDSASTRLYPTLADARARRNGRVLPAHQFEIRILERKEFWLRVRLRWPVDVCNYSEAPTQAGEYWVRYLDGRGRPLMFYPSRGC